MSVCDLFGTKLHLHLTTCMCIPYAYNYRVLRTPSIHVRTIHGMSGTNNLEAANHGPFSFIGASLHPLYVLSVLHILASYCTSYVCTCENCLEKYSIYACSWVWCFFYFPLFEKHGILRSIVSVLLDVLFGSRLGTIPTYIHTYIHTYIYISIYSPLPRTSIGPVDIATCLSWLERTHYCTLVLTGHWDWLRTTWWWNGVLNCTMYALIVLDWYILIDMEYYYMNMYVVSKY